MKTVTGYLIVSASGDMRVVKQWRRAIRVDEVAYKVAVSIPEGWGCIRGDIELTMPEPPAEAILSEWPVEA